MQERDYYKFDRFS